MLLHIVNKMETNFIGIKMWEPVSRRHHNVSHKSCNVILFQSGYA